MYRTIDAKFNAVADDIEKRHAKGQPVLVGTVSIENSERLSRLLTSRHINHSVLNAKFHEREAQIVAQAGREGAVTIATNMAGRGTDILLGGNAQVMTNDILAEFELAPDDVSPVAREAARKKATEICEEERKRVLAAGGLCVIGTERHESRRIDNQLRGRSGRQGDPGETQFYLSLEDDLMRLFGGDRMDRIGAMMKRYDMPDDMPIQAKMVTKAVEGAQRKVEEINFAMRKNVLEYDDVMNKQRRVIYEERNKILDGKDLIEHIREVTADTVWGKVADYCPEGTNPEEWDFEELTKWIESLTGKKEGLPEFSVEDDVSVISERVNAFVIGCYEEKSANVGDEMMHDISTQVMLRVIDTRWMAYLQEMDYLKTGIGLRGFGQRDPLVEYKTEAFSAFQLLVDTMYEDFLRTILHIEMQGAPMRRAVQQRKESESEEPEELRGARYSGPAEVDGDHSSEHTRTPQVQAPMRSFSEVETPPDQAKRTPYRKDITDPYANVGRNDPCPCGSGKKFKNCHGRREA